MALSPELPWPPTSGGRLRIYNILKFLSINNDISLVSFVENEQELEVTPELKRIFQDVKLILLKSPSGIINKIARRLKGLFSLSSVNLDHYYAVDFQQAINSLVENHYYDLVQIENISLAQYDFSHSLNKDLKKVIVEANVIYNLAEQYSVNSNRLRDKLELKREVKKIKRMERKTLEKADLCVTMSETDKLKLMDLSPNTPFCIVPNGVDTNYFQPDPTYSFESCSLVFTGHMGYLPNEHGILWFFHRVYPILVQNGLQPTIYLVGKQPPPSIVELAQKHSNVIVTGFVEDVRDFLKHNSIFICPLLMGSGTRLKILEAMASGMPIVSTSLGCEGIDVTNDVNILIADTPEKFAEEILALYNNPVLREKVGYAANLLAVERYDWRAITKTYEIKLREITNKL